MAKTTAKQSETASGAKRKPTFEEALLRLERIVEQLDDGELPLATSLELFKEGRVLAARCRELLEQAETDVRRALDDRRQNAADDLSSGGFVEEEEDGA